MLYIQTSYLCSTIRKNNMRHVIDIIKKLLLLVLLIVFVVDLQAQETVSLNGQWLMGEGRCYAQTVAMLCVLPPEPTNRASCM